jgi:hypothetical protein
VDWDDDPAARRGKTDLFPKMQLASNAELTRRGHWQLVDDNQALPMMDEAGVPLLGGVCRICFFPCDAPICPICRGGGSSGRGLG